MKNRALDFRLARTVGAIRLLTELPDEGWVSIRSSPKGVEIHSPVQVATRRKFCPHTCAGKQKNGVLQVRQRSEFLLSPVGQISE